MTHADRDALRWRIGEILKADRPQSVRQIFYQVLDPNGVASVRKGQAGYARVQRTVLEMRRLGMIDWHHVVDGTRATTYHGTAWKDAAEFLRAYRRRFTLNLWGDKPLRTEIWCESRGFEGSISALADRYRVNTVAFAGQPSDTLLFELAERINRYEDAGQRTLVLYCGDLDASGRLIEEIPRRKLAEQWGAEPDWLRVLVNPDQVRSLNLPTDESGKAVQAEAVPVGVARDLITSVLDDHVTADELAEIKAQEDEIFVKLQAFAASL